MTVLFQNDFDIFEASILDWGQSDAESTILPIEQDMLELDESSNLVTSTSGEGQHVSCFNRDKGRRYINHQQFRFGNGLLSRSRGFYCANRRSIYRVIDQDFLGVLFAVARIDE